MIITPLQPNVEFKLDKINVFSTLLDEYCPIIIRERCLCQNRVAIAHHPSLSRMTGIRSMDS